MSQEPPVNHQRSPRYLFLARCKATDVISGLQVEGLTADLSAGGCCIMTRKGPFSPGTRVRLDITKDKAKLFTEATVVYNLKDQILGFQFVDMANDQVETLARWIRGATPALRHVESGA